MLLLDELNQYAGQDSSDQVFDLLKVTDSLFNTTKGQMSIKHV